MQQKNIFITILFFGFVALLPACMGSNKKNKRNTTKDAVETTIDIQDTTMEECCSCDKNGTQKF